MLKYKSNLTVNNFEASYITQKVIGHVKKEKDKHRKVANLSSTNL